jgi:c-di-GMP-binding flagellar brake protein YcgR
MSDKTGEFLQQAIARNTGAVISLPSAGMLRHCKSRFLGQVDHSLILESPAGQNPLIAELIANQTPCGVSFRNGVYKVMFASTIKAQDLGWQFNSDVAVDAIRLIYPEKIQAVQRRANYRVEIPPDTEISMRVWRIPEHAYLKEQPLAAQEVKAEIRNLSTGGAGVRLIGKDGAMPIISTEDRLRILLKYMDQSLIIEGKMRDPMAAEGKNTLITGIQFKKLENDLEGRRILAQLTRIVGELQREETRRTRLGLSKAG